MITKIRFEIIPRRDVAVQRPYEWGCEPIYVRHIAREHPVLVFVWQERFHDHITRNHEEYLRIENYIMHNPQKWENDKFYQS